MNKMIFLTLGELTSMESFQKCGLHNSVTPNRVALFLQHL